MSPLLAALAVKQEQVERTQQPAPSSRISLTLDPGYTFGIKK